MVFSFFGGTYMNLKKTTLLLALVFPLLGVASSQADVSQPPTDPYWRIDELVAPTIGEIGTDGDVGYFFAPEIYNFVVTNEHPSQPIVGFGVGIHLENDPGALIIPFAPFPDWHCQVMHSYHWDDVAWTGMNQGEVASAQQYFGLSWDEIFGNEYDRAAVYWSNLDSVAPGQIAPGTSSALGEFGYHLFSAEIPESPAVIKLVGGASYLGETDEYNPFDTTPVPVPGALLLSALGVGLIGRSRRSRRMVS